MHHCSEIPLHPLGSHPRPPVTRHMLKARTHQFSTGLVWIFRFFLLPKKNPWCRAVGFAVVGWHLTTSTQWVFGSIRSWRQEKQNPEIHNLFTSPWTRLHTSLWHGDGRPLVQQSDAHSEQHPVSAHTHTHSMLYISVYSFKHNVLMVLLMRHTFSTWLLQDYIMSHSVNRELKTVIKWHKAKKWGRLTGAHSSKSTLSLYAYLFQHFCELSQRGDILHYFTFSYQSLSPYTASFLAS